MPPTDSPQAIAQTTAPDVPRSASLRQKFEAFDRANPHVYSELVTLATALRRQGWKRAGMKMLFERLRWRYALQTGGEKYLLNNSYTAYYARKIMQREPHLQGFFEVRERK